MSETPRDQRDLWHEVSRTFEELGEALRVHLSPDAARSPSDPTHPSEGRAGKPADPTETEPAPWADPARAGQADDFGDPWSAATDRPGRTTAADATSATDPTTTGPADSGPTTSRPAGTSRTTAGASPTETTATASGTDAPGPAGTAPGATAPGATGTGPTSAPGTAGSGTAGTGTAGTRSTGTGAGSAAGTGPATGTGTSGTGASGTGASGTGDSDASGADGGRGWREWSGTTDGGRFGGADWESARESVRDLGSSVRRIATQAGDAARDPHVRDSAQRAARSLGDAIVTTVEDFAAELRGRMRNPRWSDTSRPPEPPPVAPIEDNRDDKP